MTENCWRRRAAAVAVLAMAGGMAACGRKKDAPSASPAPAAGISVLAEVVRRSQLPDPKRSDYPDCDFSCEMEVREIGSAERTARRIVVMLPGFRKRELHWCASLPAGGMLDLTLLPYATTSAEMKTRQRADTLDNFVLPVYFAAEVRPCDRLASSFESKPDTYFLAGEPGGASEPAGAPRARYPWSEKAGRERRSAIQKDKDAILSALKTNGGSWDAWMDRISPFIVEINEKAAAAGGALEKDGAYFERLHWKQYSALGKLADEGEPGPVKMLEHLNRELRARGIDLIVVPFPYKEEVHAEAFSNLAPADGWCEPWRQKFILQLLERDIEVVDLVPALRAARGRFPYIFYDAHDNHPAQGGIVVAAEQIAQRLQRYDLASHRTGPPVVFQTRETEWVCRPEDAATGFVPGRHYPATQVLDARGLPIEVAQDQTSAVVIMGDSYTLTPAPMVRSAALPMHLARLIGEVPNQLLGMGSSETAMNLLAREGAGFLANRCALVFVFAPTKLAGGAPSASGKPAWNWVDLPPISFPKGAR